MITETSNLMAVFAIAITLSAYLSAIRLMAIQKIADIPKNDSEADSKKWEIRKKLGYLTLADLPMVLSAFFLGVYLLWRPLFCGVPFAWLLSAGLWLFFIAGCVMVVLHVVAWIKTVIELKQGINN